MNKQTGSANLDDAAAVSCAKSTGSAVEMDLSKVKKPRDPRLDFFRGIAMFIILIAHTSWNSWTLWIPARFGFSDATEIFVFCSGMASALAFASVFDRRGWFMGSVRVAHRVWQVYWAHIGMFFVLCAWVAFIDVVGGHGDFMKSRLNLMNFFERDTPQQIIGLLSLTYVPNYFDILPMYMVILVLIPIVMGLAHLSPKLAIIFCVSLWLVTNIEAWFNWFYEADSRIFRFPAEPWKNEGWALWYHGGVIPEQAQNTFESREWFFNPFAWQLIFFAGFAFMRGWLPRPPVNKMLFRAALSFLILSLPFAYFRIYAGATWDESLNEWLKSTPLQEWRDDIRWLIWKTNFGLFRFVHFLSLAYVAWVLVGEGGKRLISSGVWGKFVKVVMTVGQQSLAIFLISMVLAQMLGYTFYPPVGHPFHITAPESDWRWLHTACVNFGGMAILIFSAYFCAFFKKQPWRGPPTPKQPT